MAYEIVTLVANGVEYAGWTRVAVRAEFPSVAVAFNLEVSEVQNPYKEFPLLPGTPVQILFTGDVVVDGYVNEYMPNANPTMHSVMVNGRSKSQDYVDCSIHHKTGHFENKNAVQIGQELDVFGIGVETDVDPGEPIEYFHTRKGSTPFVEMMRILPEKQLAFQGLYDGKLLITRCTDKSTGSRLVQGENILEMSAVLSDTEQFSQYTHVGQRRFGTKRGAHIQPKGEAKDLNVQRFRPKETVHMSDADEAKLKKAAEWEAARASGWATQASITVPGFRDQSGKLWHPNRKVYVYAPFLHIDQELLIRLVEFSQDDSGGTLTKLELVDPQAMGGSKGSSGDLNKPRFGAANDKGHILNLRGR